MVQWKNKAFYSKNSMELGHSPSQTSSLELIIRKNPNKNTSTNLKTTKTKKCQKKTQTLMQELNFTT
jgi:hypothetical protein